MFKSIIYIYVNSCNQMFGARVERAPCELWRFHRPRRHRLFQKSYLGSLLEVIPEQHTHIIEVRSQTSLITRQVRLFSDINTTQVTDESLLTQ